METPEQIAVCRDHDRAYYYGGSKRDRLIADIKFLLGLITRGQMNDDDAMNYFHAVRLFGGPQHRIPGVSWAWGGARFTYTEHT